MSNDLPVWPTELDVQQHFNGIAGSALWWGAIHEVELLSRQRTYWEARTRLAVERLEEIALSGGASAPAYARLTIKDIGTLPAEEVKA